MADTADEAIDAPAFNQMATAFAAELLKKDNTKNVTKIWTDGLTEAAKILFYGITVVLGELIEPIIEGTLQGTAKSEGAYSKIAAAALSSMFGAPISPGDFSPFRSSEGGAAKIGDAIFRMMGDGKAVLEPGDAGAKKFIGSMVNFGVEGWLNGFIFELLSESETAGFLKLEQFGQLKEIMEQVLGLGRLSRRVLNTYLTPVVVTPFEWHVNKTYRPNLLGASLLAREIARGRLTREQAFEELGRQGWSDPKCEAMLSDARKQPTIGDVIFLARTGFIQPDTASKLITEMGYDEAAAYYVVRAEKIKRLVSVMEESARVGEEAFIEGHLGAGEYSALLSAAYKDDDERGLVRALTDLKIAAKKKRMSKGDVEDGVKRGILAMADYRAWMKAEGYDDDSQLAMELLLDDTIRGAAEAARARELIQKQKDAAAAAKKAADEARRKQLEEQQLALLPDLADIKRAVIRGFLDIGRYAAALVVRKYQPADVAFLVAMLQADQDAYAAQLAALEEAKRKAADKALSLGDLERATVFGIMSVDEYVAQLRAFGFDANEAGVLRAIVEQKIADAADAKKRRDNANKTLAGQSISLGNEEDAVRRGLVTMDAFRAKLIGWGFNEGDTAIMVALLQSKIDETSVSTTRRQEILVADPAIGATLTQLEQAVIAGLRPIADYTAVLAGRRYSVSDQQLLTDLLQAKADAAAAARARQQQIQQQTSNKALPLSAVERAVILGHVTLDAYREYLSRLGYTDEDAALLVDNLMAQLQAARAADALHNSAIAALSDAGDPLAQLEADVIAGDRTIDDYATALVSRGMRAVDVNALVAWLQQRVDDATDAATLAAAVDASVKAKGLSLTDFQAAVRNGIRTLADYGAFVQQQGYGAADAQVLMTLLAGQIARAAPRSG